MNLDDFLDNFNLIDRAQGLLWGLTSWLPYRCSHKGRKEKKWRVDGGTTEIRIDRMTNTGGEAERILAAACIPIAGRRIRAQEAIFSVKTRQAAWAELILMRARVRLAANHKMIDPDNARYAAEKGPVPLWGQAHPDAEQNVAQNSPLRPPTPRRGRRQPQPKRKRRSFFDL